VTDYIYGPNTFYVNNECARYFAPQEVSENVYMGVWLYTYWQQSNYQRKCLPNNYTGAGGAPIPLDMVGNPSNVPNCNNAELILNQSVFPVAAEYVTLRMSGTYITSWGRTKTQMATTINGPVPETGGAAQNLTFCATCPVQFTFATLLQLAGVDLDSPNILNDGGWGPGTAPANIPTYPNYTAVWPIYRLTGVELVMDMQYQNFKTSLLPPDPFNLNDYLVANLRVASAGTFRSPGSKVWYLGSDPTQPEAYFMVRRPYGILLSFSPGGSIGKTTFSAIVASLVGAVVLFGAATAIVDVMAAFLIEGFREQKFEDELELRIRLMLRTQLADVPSRGEINEYQKEELAKRHAAEAQEQRLRSRYDRLRVMNKKSITAVQRSKMVEAAGVMGGMGGGGRGAAAADGGGGGDGGQAAAPAAPAAGADRGESANTLRGTPPPPLVGAVTSLSPRVARLVLAGDCYHSSTFTAQGFLENCRCVRFQWFTSRDGNSWLPIQGSTLPTFYAGPDEVAHLLACEATPVTDDGVEGPPVRAITTSALRSPAHVLGAVQERARIARTGWTDMKDGVWVSGMRATLRLHRSQVSARTKNSIELGRVDIPGCTVELSREKPTAMTLWGSDGMSFDFSFSGAEQRDIVALIIRELAGASLELLNNPEYHPTPLVEDVEEEEE